MEARRAQQTVVVGGGIVGMCVASRLQRTGRLVTVVERGVPGNAASGHNAGVISIGDCVPTAIPGVVRSVPRMLRDPLSPLVIRWSYLPRLAPWLVRFAAAGRRRRVESIAGALQSLTDQALKAYQPLLDTDELAGSLRPGGLLFTFLTPDSFESSRFALDLRTRRGVSLRVLDDHALADLDPVLGGRFHRGVHLLDPYHTTDPARLTRALASRFMADGGQLVRADVVGFDASGGRVTQVMTTTRGPIPSGEVVVAAGAWSRPLARRLGADVPLDTERGYGVQLPDPGVVLPFPIISADHHVALSPIRQGIQLSGLDELGGLRAEPNMARADRLVAGARAIFPELRTAESARWMSYRPSMPDSLPVIGRAPRFDNAFLAFGHGHKGLTQAAITAELVQQLMDDEPTTIDVGPFSPERFRLRRRLTSWRRAEIS